MMKSQKNKWTKEVPISWKNKERKTGEKMGVQPTKGMEETYQRSSEMAPIRGGLCPGTTLQKCLQSWYLK